MAAAVKYVITFLIAGALCGFIGFGVGVDEGYARHQREQRVMGIGELRALLKENEEQQISDLVKASATISKKDEGGFFKTKWVHYIECRVLNSASVATVKDVKLRLDFFSKTDALVNSQEISVYEFIRPNREHIHKQQVKWPEDAEKFTITVINAGYDKR